LSGWWDRWLTNASKVQSLVVTRDMQTLTDNSLTSAFR